MAREKPQEVNLALLLSDGQANVGETDLEQIGSRALDAREHGITVSTLGVGRNYNEALMAEVRRRKRSTGSVLDAETILGHRDADRR